MGKGDDLKSTNTIRLDYLDALRGIAAMMVVVYHYINWYWADQLDTQLATLIFNGRDAVSFFFVLSGFVLAYKYFNYDTPLQFGKYVFRRFFRLYPAYIVTIALNWAAWIYAPSLAETIDKIIRLNYGPVLAELSMIMYQHNYYVPGWSLGVEMRISLLVPLFIILARWRGSWLWPILVISLFFQPPFITIYLFHFICGMLIAFYYRQIIAWDWKTSWLYRWRFLFFVLLFVLFNLRVFEHIFSMPVAYTAWAAWLGIEWSHYSALASAGIILIALWDKSWQQQLSRPWLLYLGKISYGIYLSHWLFVTLVMQSYEELIQLLGLPEWIGFGFYLLVVIIGTLLLAHGLYVYVERPVMRWVRKVW